MNFLYQKGFFPKKQGLAQAWTYHNKRCVCVCVCGLTSNVSCDHNLVMSNSLWPFDTRLDVFLIVSTTQNMILVWLIIWSYIFLYIFTINVLLYQVKMLMFYSVQMTNLTMVGKIWDAPYTIIALRNSK